MATLLWHKEPARASISCPMLVLYGIRAPIRTFMCMEATYPLWQAALLVVISQAKSISKLMATRSVGSSLSAKIRMLADRWWAALLVVLCQDESVSR